VIERVVSKRSQSWLKQWGARLLNEPPCHLLLQRLSGAEMLRMWILNTNGEDTAGIVGVVSHGQIYYANCAFELAYEHWSVGQMLTQYSIADMCADECAVYDFGQGHADYR